MFWRTSSAILSWLPQLQSHRGYWVKGLQQNSLVSVQEAYRLGYQIVEFDVRLTLDQEVVLFHDETFETNKLEQTNYEEFKRKIQHKYPQLSKLKDVLSWMVEKKQKKQDFNFKLNIEIKSKKIFDGRLEREVCHLIEKFNLSDRVLISSFNPFVLWRVRRKSPQFFRALLVTNDAESNLILNYRLLNFLAFPDVLNLRWNDFDPYRYRKLLKKIPIVLWTINDRVKLENFRGHIFGIISDQITPEEFNKIS